MKKFLLIASVIIISTTGKLYAQNDKESPLKISGVVQVDAKIFQTEDGKTESTIGVRRGFLKSTYTNSWGQAVLQINVTEKGVGVKDAYIKLQPPKVEWLNLTAGLFFRPFGYEISYAAAARETPERVRVITSIFPDERDLGVVASLSAPAKSLFKGLKLDFGVVNGNGIAFEDKTKYGDLNKDFVSRLTYARSYQKLSFGVGTSYYRGKVALFDGFSAYEMRGGSFQAMNLQGGDMLNKEVFDVEAQLTLQTGAGKSILRGEYVWGTQPGLKNSTVSNSGNGYLNSKPGDVYLRPFSGAYLYLIQDLFSPKHSAVFRWDYYDPNTKLSDNSLLTDGDVKFTTLGAGYMFNPTSNIRLLAFYEWIWNEKSNGVNQRFAQNIKDNMLTLRIQYKF